MSVSSDYARAMIRGDIIGLLRIENKYGLLGYPPQVVSIGLNAVDAGEDPRKAVDDYLSGFGEPT